MKKITVKIILVLVHSNDNSENWKSRHTNEFDKKLDEKSLKNDLKNGKLIFSEDGYPPLDLILISLKIRNPDIPRNLTINQIKKTKNENPVSILIDPEKITEIKENLNKVRKIIKRLT